MMNFVVLLIVQLTAKYIFCLNACLSNNLNLVKNLYMDDEEESTTIFQNMVVSISVFESLLCCSLFTGRTLSYANSIVWKKQTADEYSASAVERCRWLDQ